VEICSSDAGSFGELSVIFRTQSASLIEVIDGVLPALKNIEDMHLAPLQPIPIWHAL
jgi:hypothetical protein